MLLIEKICSHGAVDVSSGTHDIKRSPRPRHPRRNPCIILYSAIRPLGGVKSQRAVEVVNDLQSKSTRTALQTETRQTIVGRPPAPARKNTDATYRNAIDRARPDVKPFNSVFHDIVVNVPKRGAFVWVERSEELRLVKAVVVGDFGPAVDSVDVDAAAVYQKPVLQSEE